MERFRESSVASGTAERAGADGPPSRSSYRWVLCALLFSVAAINYIDRQVIGILKPTLARDLHWNEIDYANVVFVFQLAYAAGYVLAGRMVDRLGSRHGFSLAVLLWSLAAMGHALARSVAGFSIARALLGLGEGGSFPASLRTVSEWFPPRERALASGIFNAGTNIGALITPLLVPWITLRFGWRAAFLATGGLGLVWIALWLLLYRRPPASAAAATAPPTWASLLRHRQTWAVAGAKFLTDPFWFVYLFWAPDFLHRTYGITLGSLGPPLVCIYLVSDAGSIAGGWLSSFLLRRGWSVPASRKTALLCCAIAVLPILHATHASGVWAGVAVVGLAAAGHQGWSANIYAIITDMFPTSTVASAVGLSGMAGALGGMLVAKVVGAVLQSTGSFGIVFAMAAAAYPAALGLLQLVVPRLSPVGSTPAALASG